MILTCPSCETQYFAEDSTIGDSGRSVKCAACEHTWHVHPPGMATPETAAAVATGAHEAYRLKLRERRKRQSNMAGVAVWVTMFALLVGVTITAVLFRNQVVGQWPQSASAYKLFGLDVNRFGLDFESIDAQRTFEGTMPILIISGTVRNISQTDQTSSDVKVSLRDERGDEVAELIASLDVQALGPGQLGQFSTRLENPPVDAFDLELSFMANQADAKTGMSSHIDAAPTEADPASP